MTSIKQSPMTSDVYQPKVDYLEVDYSEFDYEFDDFMDCSDDFEELYPGFFKNNHANIYNFIKHESLEKSSGYHLIHCEKDSYVEDYADKIINIVMHDVEFENFEKEVLISYLHDYLLCQIQPY